MKASRRLLLLSFATVYLVWGSTYLALRFALVSLPPFLLASIRLVIAGAFLLAVGWRSGGARPTWRQWRAAAIGGLLFFGLTHGALNWAQQFLPSGTTALIAGSIPLWITLFSWFVTRSEKPTWRVALGIASGFVGVGVLVGGAFGNARAVAAILVALGGAASWSLGSTLVERLELPTSAALRSGMMMLGGAAVLVPVALVRGETAQLSWSAFSVASVGALLYLVVMGTIVAFLAYQHLLRHAPATTVGTYAFVNPVVAVILGALIASEPLTRNGMLGMALIVISVVTVVTRRARPAKAESTAPAPTRDKPAKAWDHAPAVTQ